MHGVLLCVLPGSFSTQVVAQSSSADEYDIRAAMLLNLTRFIEWPASKFDASHPQFVICILGQDPIEASADRLLQNQSVGPRPVQVRHLKTLDGASSCHILYVASTAGKSFERSLPELMKDGVLVMSERPNSAGGTQVIGLPSIEEHVHIEVDLSAAQRTGLTFSSKLLRLASVTH